MLWTFDTYINCLNFAYTFESEQFLCLLVNHLEDFANRSFSKLGADIVISGPFVCDWGLVRDN